jgi:hypothetical protein
MTVEHSYTYSGALADSQKVNWRVKDSIGGDKKLDFSKPFLPESLARVSGIEVLNPREQLIPSVGSTRSSATIISMASIRRCMLGVEVRRASGRRPASPARS